MGISMQIRRSLGRLRGRVFKATPHSLDLPSQLFPEWPLICKRSNGQSTPTRSARDNKLDPNVHPTGLQPLRVSPSCREVSITTCSFAFENRPFSDDNLNKFNVGCCRQVKNNIDDYTSIESSRELFTTKSLDNILNTFGW